MEKITAQELYAQLYDVRVPDWEGELDFYQTTLGGSPLKDYGTLEIACGTGRIAVRLAQAGLEVTGLDISPELLAMAQRKSAGLPHVNWVLGDMRNFQLGRQFGHVISPGHSFQFMTTPNEQVACLERVKDHLIPNGLAIIHIDYQDFNWLASLLDQKEPVYEKSALLTHPTTGEKFRRSFAWTFEPSTQTATVTTHWEQIDQNGDVLKVWKMKPARLHCIFPFEMEHLLKRAGFAVEAVYGDFFKSALTDASEQMIWLARNATG